MTRAAAAFERSPLGRYFGFAENGTTVWRDTAAGATTFIVMSYIIFVNPAVLGFLGVEGLEGQGLPVAAVAASTCLVAGVMTIAMGLLTNRAFAIAPGLGLNAVVAFGLVAGEGLGFPEAMGIVVMDGILVALLVVAGLREKVMAAIPLELKKAIAIGIGLFIAFIGLTNAGVVVRGDGTLVALGEFTTWPSLIVVVGLVLTLALRARGFRGDILVGIVLTTAVAVLVNRATGYEAFPDTARWPGEVVSRPDFSLVGAVSFDSFATIGIVATLVWVFALMLADFFDTMGTLVGVGKQAGYLTEAGELPGIRRPLLVDAAGAIAGGAASASSATTYIESGSGVAVGGRTGWVAVVAGALFFPFLFVGPLIGMVPPQATAPALIIVGWLMMTALSEAESVAEGRPGRRLAGIDFHDLAIGFAAALTIMIMPFTFSITNGIGFGFIAYVVIRLAQGEWRRVHPLMAAAALAFVAYFLVPLLQQSFDWL